MLQSRIFIEARETFIAWKFRSAISGMVFWTNLILKKPKRHLTSVKLVGHN
jgi:hypothetical protein